MLAKEWAALMLGVQFLTRIPLAPAYSEDAMGHAPRYFPLIGLALGGFGAFVIIAGTPLFGLPVAVLLALGWQAFITGGLHEDGLADMADGLGGGATPERALEIMRDSRIGSYGALALGLTLALTATGLMTMGSTLAAPVLVLAQSASRFSMVLAIATSSYIRPEGAGSVLAQKLGPGALTFAAVVGLGAFWLLPGEVWAGAAIGLVSAHIGTRILYERKLGGYTGDCLGALQQISQLGLILGVLAWA